MLNAAIASSGNLMTLSNARDLLGRNDLLRGEIIND